METACEVYYWMKGMTYMFSDRQFCEHCANFFDGAVRFHNRDNRYHLTDCVEIRYYKNNVGQWYKRNIIHCKICRELYPKLHHEDLRKTHTPFDMR